jgi:ferritin-like protein
MNASIDPRPAAALVLPGRRRFFGRSGGLVLSTAALGLLAGRDSLAAAGAAGMQDVDILNVALGLEHEAINAYQLGAGSGLLQKPVLDVAVLFQSHHKAHRDALVATIEKLGGKPVMEKKVDEYAIALKADTLKSQADVLTLAARLELGATNAYLGVIPAFGDAALAKVAARLAADEAMHWTALTGALARALPSQALSFGA